MDSVFVLQHVHTLPGGVEDVKMIGVYRTEEAAMSAVRRLGAVPGFKEYPTVIKRKNVEARDGFFLSRYQLDTDHWREGFVTRVGDGEYDRRR